jgi:hypothetical protein
MILAANQELPVEEAAKKIAHEKANEKAKAAGRSGQKIRRRGATRRHRRMDRRITWGREPGP